MSLLDAVDIYCERTDATYWAEPINAVTNLSFIAAGLYGLKIAQDAQTDVWPKVFSIWVMVIGLGSFLFHTHANTLAGLLDIIPIWSFFLGYIIFALRRFLALSWPKVLLGLLFAAALLAIPSRLLPDWLYPATNGSIKYLPAIVALIAFSIILNAAGSRAGRYILAATGIFAISILFRSVDMEVCAALPIGTHFLWHVLNGIMLAFLLLAAIKFGAKQPAYDKVTP